LTSPINGQALGDFIVYPRFVNREDRLNDYIQLIHILKDSIQPEFDFKFDLVSNDQARPPLFYECVKYINSLFVSIRKNWHKFSSTKMDFKYPKGDIIWREYLKNEFNPKDKLIFPCRVNKLSKNHSDNSHLAFVYKLAKEEIFTHAVPQFFRNSIKKKMPVIEEYFSSIISTPTTKLKYRNSDPVLIRKLKIQGNKILSYETLANKAWRIDFTLVFERYIQHLFENTCNAFGYKYKKNPHLSRSSSNNPKWTLKYLEPDMYLYKGNISIFVDAKYKSHFYNLSSASDFLRKEHRSDIHQISAYCAFEKSDNKVGILCYPSNNLSKYKIMYKNRINSSNLSIYLFGIPISSRYLKTVENGLKKEFSNIVSENIQQ